MGQKIYYIGLPEESRRLDASVTVEALETILNNLKPGETLHVTTRERHAFIKVTEKYPGGAPSLLSFVDVCGMPECGRPSNDVVHY